jgi:hypothetical protein
MPRYISMHTLGCLTRQGAEQLLQRLRGSPQFTTRRVMVNTVEGKMLVECEAPNREMLEAWLAAERFHYDWLLRVEYEATGGGLVAV